jgi:hypothetical protein
MDVMFNPMGWCWHHIPGAQNRGVFLQKSFHVSGDRVRYFLQSGGGGSNIDWFSLKLKLTTSPRDSKLHVRIWQEAGKKSSQQAAGLKLELIPVSEQAAKERGTRPLKAEKRGQDCCKQIRGGRRRNKR